MTNDTPQGPDAGPSAVPLGLLGVALVLLHEVVLPGRIFFERDILLQWRAQARAFVRAVHAGSWPLWDPATSFGQPLWANPNNEVLYPPTWLLLGMRPETYYTVLTLFHVVLAGAGLYALARRLGLSPLGSLLSGSWFMASGPLLSAVNLWNHLAGIAWLPWVLWTADLALDSLTLRGALAWGAAMALQALTGSPDAVALTLMALLPFVLLRLRRGSAGRAAWLAILAAVFGAALAAGQWLPTLDMLRGAARWTLSAGERTFWSLRPILTTGAVLPFFPLLSTEFPLRPEIRASLTESREPLLRSLYLGLPSLLFVGAAIVGRRPRLWGLWTTLAGAAAGLALGRYTPVFAALTGLLPPLGLLRFPMKAMLLVAFAWSLLVGGGFDAWREGPAFRGRAGRLLALPLLASAALGAAAVGLLLFRGPAGWPLSTIVASPSDRALSLFAATLVRLLVACCGLAGACLLALVRSPPGPRAALLAALLALGELLLNHHDLNETAPAALLGYPQALEGLAAGTASRLYVYDYLLRGTSLKYLNREVPYMAARYPRGLSLAEIGALTMRNYAYPPAASEWDFSGSYDRDLLGILPVDLDRLTALLGRFEGTPHHLRLLQMGAVTHVVALHQVGFEDLLPVRTLASLTPEDIHVYRVPDPLPRAYVANRVRFAEGRAALTELAREDFDPHVETILSGPPPGTTRAESSGVVRIEDFKPDRVRLEADLPRAGYVILVDTYDPGWRATLDGRETPVLVANGAFRGVGVPAGRHVIQYRYAPRSWVVGLGVSLTGLLAGIVILVGERLVRGRTAA